ncbi:hypothetical protein DVH05_024599 [Phytophthora capsici]|nr:hypothetical protein DVH05_024599 [Phytophthora capsici]
MELLNAIQDEVLKQKEEESHNMFSRVADLRDFITTTNPAPDVTVTLKLCCLSAERLMGGRGTRVTAVDASQRTEFEPTANALADLTPLKRKQFIAQVTVWDAKPKKGSFGKSNIDFHPGSVYTFRNVDGVGFYAEVAKGSVQYERDVNNKVFEAEAPVKKRKTARDLPKKNGKAKLQTAALNKSCDVDDLFGDDIEMAVESKEGGPRETVTTRSKNNELRA